MKYLKLFENSDLRDDYENGSDYIEPYISYTPVIINEKYIVQFNGITIPNLTVEKQENNIYYVFSPSGDRKVTHSAVFYIKDETTFLDSYLFSSELTENIRHVVYMDELDYYPVYVGDNTWDIYYDSEYSELGLTLQKYNIVSEINTDVAKVHYNKIPLAKSIYAKIYIENVEKLSKDSDPLYIKISNRNDIFEKIIIDNGADVIEFNNEEPTKGQSFNLYYRFNTYGVHNIEYVLKDEYAGIMPGGMIPSYTRIFKEITLPKGIYKIESNAFDTLESSLNKLNVPDTVTKVENCAVICTYDLEAEDFLKSINPGSVCNSCK